MKTEAAIRRATRQAQLAMHELDREGAEQLLEIYRQAAADVAAQIRAAAGAGDLVPIERLQGLLRNVEEAIDAVGNRRDELLASAVDRAATLGVRPFTTQGVAAVGGTEAVLGSEAAMRVHQAAVQFVMEFVQADGLQLSDRLWRMDRGAKEAIASTVRQAVVQGWSAQRAANDLLYSGRPIPPDLQARLDRARAGKVADSAAGYLQDPRSGGMYEATRVMRTEINRAHGEAYMAAGEGTPGFAGWRYLLSPAHPAPDICDLLSTQNLHGLGPGVYPDRKRTPWPAHPNTLSFIVIVFDTEVSDADRAGKETTLQALARLTPDQRAGAVGKTKAEYFDQGLLRPGMIRSRLQAVDARLDRQAAAGRKPHPDALPDRNLAVIERDKLEIYALNPEHRRGGDKSKVFAALGFTKENASLLERRIRQQLPYHPATIYEPDARGQRYHVDLPIQGPLKSDTVRTWWIYDPGSKRPRLYTLYVKD